MIEWSDTDLMVRDAVRQFVDKEIRPHLDELETGAMSPYPIARKLFSQFGLDVMAAESVKKMLDRERAKQNGTAVGDERDEKQEESGGFGGGAPGSMIAYTHVTSVSWGSARAVRLSWRITSAGDRSRSANV